MKQLALGVMAALFFLGVATPSTAHPLETITGKVMCRASASADDEYSTDCADSSRYVLLTLGATYEIKPRGFSGWAQLVGRWVQVTGDLHGHLLDVLQMEEIGPDCHEPATIGPLRHET